MTSKVLGCTTCAIMERKAKIMHLKATKPQS
uniref:Uncharacterized protein n=1 Tax=Rhizophora mucronata TaxID=61149 RepID=A0A2P2N6Y3_RHIMU